MAPHSHPGARSGYSIVDSTSEISPLTSVQQIADAARQAHPSLEDLLQEREDRARAVLQEAGLPQDRALVEVSPGAWKSVHALVADRPNSPEWFAAKMLEWSTNVRTRVAAADAEGAALAMGQLGRVVHMAFVAECLGLDVLDVLDVLDGRQVQAARAKGGSAPRRPDLEARIRELDAEQREKHPEHSAAGRAEFIHDKLTAAGWENVPSADTLRRRPPVK